VTIPPAAVKPSTQETMRPLVVILGLTLSTLAFVLVLLAWRLRKSRPPEAAPTTSVAPASTPPPAPARPVVNPALQRKVA